MSGVGRQGSGAIRARTLKLLEDAYALLDGRVGGEEPVEAAEEARGLLARVLDEELRHVVARDGLDVGVGRDLAQRRRQRVVRHLGSARIGQILPFARYGEAHQQRDGVAYGCDNDGDKQHDDAAALVVAARAAAVGVEQRAEGRLGRHREDADEDYRYDQQPHVVVAYVRELMRDDGLELRVVEFVDDTPRQGHRVGAAVYSAGEGVERVVVDDVYARHGHALAHAEVLHEIIYALALPAFEGPRACRRLDDLRVGEVRYDEPQQRAAEGVWRYVGEHGVCGLQQRRRGLLGACRAEPCDYEVE